MSLREAEARLKSGRRSFTLDGQVVRRGDLVQFDMRGHVRPITATGGPAMGRILNIDPGGVVTIERFSSGTSRQYLKTRLDQPEG